MYTLRFLKVCLTALLFLKGKMHKFQTLKKFIILIKIAKLHCVGTFYIIKSIQIDLINFNF